MNLPIRGFVGTNNFESIIFSMLGWMINIEFMILLISIISSVLLMSKVNYEKFPLISLNIDKRNSINLIKIMLFIFILTISIYFRYYDVVLLFFIFIYIFGNALKFLVNLNK